MDPLRPPLPSSPMKLGSNNPRTTWNSHPGEEAMSGGPVPHPLMGGGGESLSPQRSLARGPSMKAAAAALGRGLMPPLSPPDKDRDRSASSPLLSDSEPQGPSAVGSVFSRPAPVPFRRLSGQEVAPSLDGLRKLARQGQWRVIVEKVKEVGRTTSMFQNVDEQLAYAAYHVLALMKLRMYGAASDELTALGHLDDPKYRAENNPAAFPGRSGSLVPFALWWLSAELPSRLGQTGITIDRLYDLLDHCTTQIDTIQASQAPTASTVETASFSEARFFAPAMAPSTPVPSTAASFFSDALESLSTTPTPPKPSLPPPSPPPPNDPPSPLAPSPLNDPSSLIVTYETTTEHQQQQQPPQQAAPPPPDLDFLSSLGTSYDSFGLPGGGGGGGREGAAPPPPALFAGHNTSPDGGFDMGNMGGASPHDLLGLGEIALSPNLGGMAGPHPEAGGPEGGSGKGFHVPQEEQPPPPLPPQTSNNPPSSEALTDPLPPPPSSTSVLTEPSPDISLAGFHLPEAAMPPELEQAVSADEREGSPNPARALVSGLSFNEYIGASVGFAGGEGSLTTPPPVSTGDGDGARGFDGFAGGKDDAGFAAGGAVGGGVEELEGDMDFGDFVVSPPAGLGGVGMGGGGGVGRGDTTAMGKSPSAAELRGQPASQSQAPSALEKWQRRQETVMWALLNHHLAQRDFIVAIQWLERLLLQRPTDPVVLSKFGYVQLQMGDLEGARATFGRAEDLVGEGPTGGPLNAAVGILVQRNRGLLFFALKQYAAAVKEFDAVLQLDPHDFIAANNKALCLMYSRELMGAIRVLEEALERSPVSFLHETLVLNLCSMYELASTNCTETKRTLSTWIMRIAPDDFDLMCTRL